MKYLLFAVSILCSYLSFSQSSDFLILKKGERTIQTFFPGSHINFQLDDYQWLEGNIIKIIHDSIYIEQQKTQSGISMWGTPAEQTLNLGELHFNIHDIIALPFKQKGIGIINNGALFQLGGGAYILLNIFNSIAQSTPFFTGQNLTNVGIAAGVLIIGTILELSHPSEIKLGKKYSLQTINLTGPK